MKSPALERCNKKCEAAKILIDAPDIVYEPHDYRGYADVDFDRYRIVKR